MCFIFSRTFSTFCIFSICFLKKVSTNIGGLSSFAWSFRCSQRQARFPYKRKSVSTCALMWRATKGITEFPKRQRSPHSLRRTRSPELDPWRLRRVGRCLSRFFFDCVWPISKRRKGLGKRWFRSATNPRTQILNFQWIQQKTFRIFRPRCKMVDVSLQVWII